jgi:outer membrane receptor protein involved in Fe transport
MSSNPKLSCAVAAILSSPCAGFVHAAAASDAASNSEGIQEITVTAQRRTENMQDVPITIQALTAETLTQLNVATFDDFVRYLPNVTASETGSVQAFDQPGYTTYDGSLGVAKDSWLVQLYGQNITDARYVTFINAGQFVNADFVGRPRTVGLKYTYKF